MATTRDSSTAVTIPNELNFFELSRNDVIPSRRKYPGYRNYLYVVCCIASDYPTIQDSKMHEMVDRVKDRVASLSPPGRFLKRLPKKRYIPMPPNEIDNGIKKHLSQMWDPETRQARMDYSSIAAKSGKNILLEELIPQNDVLLGSRKYFSFVESIVSEGTFHPTLDHSKMAEIVERIIDHVASPDPRGRFLLAKEEAVIATVGIKREAETDPQEFNIPTGVASFGQPFSAKQTKKLCV